MTTCATARPSAIASTIVFVINHIFDQHRRYSCTAPAPRRRRPRRRAAAGPQLSRSAFAVGDRPDGAQTASTDAFSPAVARDRAADKAAAPITTVRAQALAGWVLRWMSMSNVSSGAGGAPAERVIGKPGGRGRRRDRAPHRDRARSGRASCRGDFGRRDRGDIPATASGSSAHRRLRRLERSR